MLGPVPSHVISYSPELRAIDNEPRNDNFTIPLLSNTSLRGLREKPASQVYWAFTTGEASRFNRASSKAKSGLLGNSMARAVNSLASNFLMHFAKGGKSQQHFGVGFKVVALFGRLP